MRPVVGAFDVSAERTAKVLVSGKDRRGIRMGIQNGLHPAGDLGRIVVASRSTLPLQGDVVEYPSSRIEALPMAALVGRGSAIPWSSLVALGSEAGDVGICAVTRIRRDIVVVVIPQGDPVGKGGIGVEARQDPVCTQPLQGIRSIALHDISQVSGKNDVLGCDVISNPPRLGDEVGIVLFIVRVVLGIRKNDDCERICRPGEISP